MQSSTPVEVHKISIAEKIIANVFSWIFHPLFIPLYVVIFLTQIHPGAFAGFGEGQKRQTILIIALNMIFYPLLSVLLLKGVGFIDSIFLRTKKDRIIPYMACGIFFFWTYLVFKQQPQYPLLLTSFILGVFLASSAGLMANIYFKISMHAMGMGGWLGFFLIIFKTNTMHMAWPLAAVILLTGIVCTCRLLLTSHTQKDIYAGLAVGLITQFVAAVVVM